MRTHSRSPRLVAAAFASVIGLMFGAAGPATATPPVAPGELSAPPAPAPAPAPIPAPAPALSSAPEMPTTDTPGGKQLVTFGDSFSANAGMEGINEPAQLPWQFNCRTDINNWPKIAGRELNKTLGDWSCNGTSVHLPLYVESAINYGDIGPNTEEVVFMYGGLDPFHWTAAIGEWLLPGGVDPSVFRTMMRAIGDRIHQVAPNARLTLTSYLEYISSDTYCPINAPIQVPIAVPGATAFQDNWRNNIRSVAHDIGFNFIDVYEESKGHGVCNPNPDERWTVALVESAPHTMANHPTIAGEIGMGKIIANHLRD